MQSTSAASDACDIREIDSLTNMLTDNPKGFEAHLRGNQKAMVLLKKHYYTIFLRAAESLQPETTGPVSDSVAARRGWVRHLHKTVFASISKVGDKEDRLIELLSVPTFTIDLYPCTEEEAMSDSEAENM
jgi:hypothetical protein